MPRDGSGLYSLPAGNPVVTNTIIASAWANSTLGDIAAQLNNVFTRDGLLGPTAPFKIVDGTVNAPGLAFNAEPSTGWFRAGAMNVGFAAGGARVANIEAGTTTTTLTQLFPRAAGDTSALFYNQPSNVLVAQRLQVGIGAGGSYIYAAGINGAAKPNLTLDASAIALNGGTVTTGSNLNVLGTMGQSGGWSFSSDGNNAYQSAPAANWFWAWNKTSGNLAWLRNGGPTTTFVGNGDFYAGRDIYTGNGDALALINNAAGGVRTLRFTSDNWKLEWDAPSGGSLIYYTPGGAQLFRVNGSGDAAALRHISAGGNIAATGNIEATNNVRAVQSMYVAPHSGLQFLPDGGWSSGPIYCMISQGNPSWNQMYLRLAHQQGSWAGMELFSNAGGNGNMHFKISGNPVCDGNGPGGNWNCSISGFGYTSDATLKENIADADNVLARFRAIRFREFNRIGHIRREIGVIAQELVVHEPNALFFDDDNEAIPAGGPDTHTDPGPDDPPPVVDPMQYSHRYMLRADHIHFLAGAALQVALDTIDMLEARVAALEAAP